MNISWNEAEPEALPDATIRSGIRLILRATVVVITLTCMFALFLALRGVELLFGLVVGRKISRMSGTIVQIWARIALACLGLRLDVTGAPVKTPGAFVANHSSWIDIIALQAAAAPFLVSKSEVRSWPVVGLIGRAIGTMFIDRKAAAVKQQEAALLGRLKNGDHMAVFPEGTSTDGQRVLNFRSSLFAVFFSPDLAGSVAAQPVAISYRPRQELPRSFYAWWGAMEFADHLVAVLAHSTGGTVKLIFLDPILVPDVSGRKEMAALAGDRVRNAFENL